MATNPTNNPIPSEDPRDLKFNAGKIDEEVNGSADYYTDRFGVQRLTNAGRNHQFQDAQAERSSLFTEQLTSQEEEFTTQLSGQEDQFNQQISEQHGEFTAQITEQRNEFNDMLAASGYSWLADYVDGPVTFTNRSQVTVYNGVAYRLSAATDIPFTTTGNNATSWANDSTHLVAIGDNDIRQQVQYQFGQWLPSVVAALISNDTYSSIRTRGFYAPNDGGDGVWIATGNTVPSKAGTHDPAKARIYNANGVEYQLNVQSGFEINAKANGVKAVDDVDAETEDFVCLGEAINGITSRVKTMVNDEDLKTYLKVIIPSEYPLRIGKTSIKAYSRLKLDFQQASIYDRPSPSNRQEVTGVYMNAIERGIEDIQAISAKFSGATSYSNMTLSDFHIEGGKFYGDHTTDKGVADCSTGTGLFTYNMENSSIRNTWFQGFACGRQYNRTGPGYYFDNLGYKVVGTLVPEVTTSGTGSYEGVKEWSVTAYGCRYLYLRVLSNWARFDNCKFGTYADWSSSPDGNQCEYFIENRGAGVVFSGGVIEANTAAANPTKGYVRDFARGCTFEGVYYENCLSAGWVVAIPEKSQYNRANGLFLTAIGSQFTLSSKGAPLIKFEEGYFGSYNPATGLYETGGWETNYQYAGGVNTWSVGQPVVDSGAFPHGGYDFKYGTYGIHYSGSVPDVDSLRDTPEGNEFLSQYGLPVNSGILLFTTLSPAYQSNIVVWYKDLTGNFDPRNIVVGDFDNNNVSDGTSNALYRTNGFHYYDYGNGYKAAIVPYVNPRALDNRMTTSAGRKLKITVTSDAPIILKNIQAFVGGTPLFPPALKEYVPRSQRDRVWGTMSAGSTDSGAYYGPLVGGGIFRPGDVVLPFVPFSNAALMNPASYTDISAGYGSNTDTAVITGGAAWGAGLAGATFTLTVEAQDTTNNWTTVSVPSAYLPYVFTGMPVNVTANSSGGATGLINTVRRIINSDGTMSNKYVLSGALGAAGTTLTASTNGSYTVRSGVSSTLTGVSGSFSVSSWLGTASGDLRVGFGASGSGTRQTRYYYNGTDVSAVVGSSAANALHLTGTGGITLNGSLLTSTSYSFGSASAYPANIYSQNAVTVVSDERYKTDIVELSDAEIECAKACAKLYRRYKLNTAIALKGEGGARYHVGTIAQLVMQAFTDAGLDWTKYGIITYESWEASDAVVETLGAVYDEEGNELAPETTIEVTPAKKAGEIYMVRYDEFNSFVMAGQEARLQALEEK